MNKLHTVKDILLAIVATIEQDTTPSEKAEQIKKIKSMITEVFETPLDNKRG